VLVLPPVTVVFRRGWSCHRSQPWFAEVARRPARRRRCRPPGAVVVPPVLGGSLVDPPGWGIPPVATVEPPFTFPAAPVAPPALVVPAFEPDPLPVAESQLWSSGIVPARSRATSPHESLCRIPSSGSHRILHHVVCLAHHKLARTFCAWPSMPGGGTTAQKKIPSLTLVVNRRATRNL